MDKQVREIIRRTYVMIGMWMIVWIGLYAGALNLVSRHYMPTVHAIAVPIFAVGLGLVIAVHGARLRRVRQGCGPFTR